MQELMLNHETKLCMTALKEIYQEWEKAEEEKQVRNCLAFLRTSVSNVLAVFTLHACTVQVKDRSRKKGSNVEPAAAPAPAAAAPAEVPLEGAVFLLLMGGCCAMSLGEYPVARRVLSAAE